MIEPISSARDARLIKSLNQVVVDQVKMHHQIDLCLASLSQIPIRRIPPELLSEIFLRCIPEHPLLFSRQPPLLFGQVSSHWRAIALSILELWNKLSALKATSSAQLPSLRCKHTFNAQDLTYLWRCPFPRKLGFKMQANKKSTFSFLIQIAGGPSIYNVVLLNISIVFQHAPRSCQWIGISSFPGRSLCSPNDGVWLCSTAQEVIHPSYPRFISPSKHSWGTVDTPSDWRNAWSHNLVSGGHTMCATPVGNVLHLWKPSRYEYFPSTTRR